MKAKRFFAVLGIALFSVVCIAFMNLHYDPLSRYPYENEEARRLIVQHLNGKEIEYIIEYVIQPSEFIEFIEETNFNVYNIESYKRLRELLPALAAKDLVDAAEAAKGQITDDELGFLLQSYSSEELQIWFSIHDPYNPNSILITEPNEFRTYVNNSRTISVHVPRNLTALEGIPYLTQGQNNTIEVKEDIIEPLKNLCKAAKEEVSRRACGGLVVTEGYVDFEGQIQQFDQAKAEYGSEAHYFEEYPGHSEHQLGLAVDFQAVGVKSEDFAVSPQAAWLKQNAHRFGFILSYDETKSEITGHASEPFHFRYVGDELANKIFTENITLKEAVNQ